MAHVTTPQHAWSTSCKFFRTILSGCMGGNQTKGLWWLSVITLWYFCNRLQCHFACEVWKIFCRSTIELSLDNIPLTRWTCPFFIDVSFITEILIIITFFIYTVFLGIQNTTSWQCTYLGYLHVVEVLKTWMRFFWVQPINNNLMKLTGINAGW